MHIIVCVKQVPDTTEVKIDPKTNALDRSSAPAILNPYDAHAVEEAVRLKEKFGGKVTVLSMGPPGAKDVIKRSISLGADQGFLLGDRYFAGSDTLATSYILAEGIRKVCREEPYDLILCGKQAIDGDTAQVGPGISRRLSIPQLTSVNKILGIDTGRKEITVQRKTDDGYVIVAVGLPCLITVDKTINQLRYASLPNMLRAARYKPVVLTAADLNVDITSMGIKGSPTSVAKVFAPTRLGRAEMLQGDEYLAVVQLANKLAKKLA